MRNKIFYLNFSVGSGIEYIGNLFYNFIKDEFDVFNYTLQNPSFIVVEEIIKFKPDIIILNEIFPRTLEASYFYKKFNPHVKVIQICHDWCRVFGIFNKEIGSDTDTLMQYFLNNIDCIFLLNFKNRNVSWPKNFIGQKNIVQGYFSSGPEFYIKKPWNSRKDICFIGNIGPLRIKESFLKNLVYYPNIKIDCYGFRKGGCCESYYELFDSIPNVKYFGVLDQKNVADVLNEYKYFICAHDDCGEVFFLIILQAILCGTIPLISFKTVGNTRLDNNWLDWADGHYFGCESEIELLKNTDRLLKENPDLSEISQNISNSIRKRFDLEKLKKKFINTINGSCN